MAWVAWVAFEFPLSSESPEPVGQFVMGVISEAAPLLVVHRCYRWQRMIDARGLIVGAAHPVTSRDIVEYVGAVDWIGLRGGTGALCAQMLQVATDG